MGEKRLVKGTFPHVTPFVSRRPLTRPRQPPPRRRLRRVGPGPIRVVSMSARTSTPPAPAASHTARRLLREDKGWYIVQRRPCRRHPSGRPAITPTCPLQIRPIHLLQGPGPDTGSETDVPDFPVGHQEGVTHTTPSATHPVHLWLAERASASRPNGSRRRNAVDCEHTEKAVKAFEGRLRGEVAQGGREDHRRPRRAPGVLRLPRRGLSVPLHQPPIESTFATVKLRQRLTKGPS